MNEQPPNTGRKPVHPLVFVAPVIAVVIGSGIVLSSSNEEPRSLEPPDDNVVTVQSTPQTPQPPAPGDNATADGALTFSDETLVFSAALPPGPAGDPILKQLRTETQQQLDKAKADAKAGAQDRKSAGAPPLPWETKVQWKYTAKAGDLVSLVGTSYEFTGGAHGMTHTDTRIARADTGKQLSLDDLMLPDRSPSPALVIAVCEALKAAKQKAIGSPTIFDEPIVCAGMNANVKVEEAKFALAPSTEANRFGGLFVYYEPYAVGAYAEGSYSLSIPQEVFREDLRKAFQPLFAGGITGEP